MSDKNVRAGHRGIATRLIAEINVLLTQSPIDEWKLKLKVKSLDNRREKIENLDEKIQVELSEGESLFKDMEESFAVLSNIEESIMEAEEYIKRNAISTRSNNPEKQVVKLPTLQLPSFSGNPIEWMHFWDTFRAAVHVRADITGASKFSYLIGQLKGESKQLLEGFTTTDDHYIEAIKLLEETYGKPNKIIQAHVNAILDMCAPKSNARELSRFRASYECHLRALKTLQVDVEAAGFILAIVLIRKLPMKIKDNISRATQADSWTLSAFREAINKEIEMLQVTEPDDKLMKNVNETSKLVKDDFQKEEPNQPKATASAFNISSSRKICKFCQSQHRETECKQFKTASLRSERAKELNLCYNCLSDKHRVRDCTSYYTCRNCQGWHHISLCFKVKDKDKQVNRSIEAKSNVENKSSVMVSAIKQVGYREKSVALPTAMLPIKTESGIVNVRALFDQGSQKTFILRSTVQDLKLKLGQRITLRIDGFQSVGCDQDYRIALFEVLTRRGKIPVEAVIVENLPARIEVPGLVNAIQKIQSANIYLADPVLKSDIVEEVNVLIGADQYYNFVSGHQTVKGIRLLNSSLGCMISGPISTEEIRTQSVTSQMITVLKTTVRTLDIDESIKRIWSLDSIGMGTSTTEGVRNEKNLLESFQKNIFYSNGRYTVKLPWKQDHEFLPTNYGIARGRLTATLKNLRKIPSQLTYYDKVIKDQIAKEFVVKLEDDGRISERSKIHFLSHHGVKKDSPTTPLRVVYDCSAGRPSLNQCLHTGPSLMHDLCAILLRFRLGRFACISDIAKAYHMIGLHLDDQDSTRFLWPEDPFVENSPLNTYRFKVVLFGATCSQFLLNATVCFHLKNNDSEVARDIGRNIYVDNIQGVYEEENKLMHFYKESKSLMSKAGFIVREWATNSSSLQKLIDANGDGGTLKKPDEVGVLGLLWNTSSDSFSIPFNKIELEKCEFTKRNVVSKTAKVFDPLGILTPVTIKSRIFIQDLWKEKYNWDQVIEDRALFKRWMDISINIEQAMQFRIPRRLQCATKLSLHAFSDASARAYGAVIYISDSVESQFVIAKARVAPVRTMTIPKLELTAATVAAQLISYVVDSYSQELKFESIYLWIDSQVTLHWITSDRELTSYIQNRVNDIRMLCNNANFRYVPTADNPADFLTKGMKTKDFINSQLWRCGPTWLNNENDWPKNDWKKKSFDEIKASYLICANNKDAVEEDTMDIERYSSLKKLLHVSVLSFRFIKLLRKETATRCTLEEHLISVDELEYAEKFWIKRVQMKHFKIEQTYLSTDKTSSGKCPNLVFQLNLFLEDDLLKCKTRLQHADIDYSSKNPILLPSKCYFSKLLILDAHIKTHHGGIALVMDRLRQRFWIPCLRQRIKNILRFCVTCKKIHGKPYAVPNAPSLPKQRVQERRPFSITGVDYTGALIVKDNKLDRKVYISLFTCAITRAIHLELVADNSCETFIRAFRRFVSRRSCPRLMMSDNSTTFVSSAQFLRKLQQDAGVKSVLNENHCEWRFIPSRAPWFGGYWERLIALTKMSIKKVLGKAFVSFDEMHTLVIEVEGILNDRPLTIGGNSLDDFETLSPSQLLYGHRIGNLPDPVEDDLDPDFMTPSYLSARQKRCNKLRSQFWKRWSNEYLLSLRARHFEKMKKFSKTQIEQGVKVNDIVLIHEEGPRLGWKIGRIKQLFISEDGYVRSAVLKTSKSEITRPISKLYPLEVNFSDEMDSDGRNLKPDDQTEVPRKSTRKAAIQAADAIKKQLCS